MKTNLLNLRIAGHIKNESFKKTYFYEPQLQIQM